MIASAVTRDTTNASNQSRLIEMLGFGGLVVSGETVMQDSRDSSWLRCNSSHHRSLDVSVCHSVLVFVDDAFFHHEHHMFRLPDIFKGIAGYGHDVGGFSGFQRADLVGHPE